MILVWAFVAMLAQDVFLTWKSLAVNRNRPVIGGLCDMLGGFCVIATVGVGIGAVHSHGLSWSTVAVFAALGAADFLGASLGAWTGNRWIHADNLSPVRPKETR